MRKGIYTYYKERLIEIGGNNKCLYLKSVSKKGSYDIGRILEGRGEKVAEFLEFLWTSKRFSLTLIGNKEKKEIIENLDIQSKLDKRTLDTSDLYGEELLKASQKNDRMKREEANKAIESEISKIKDIKRTSEELEKETGRSELYIGYPYVFGSINNGAAKTAIKAPLLLFPIKIDIPDENTVELSINEREKIQINRALIFAYAQSKKLSIDQMETEFDNLSQFPTVSHIVKYLESFHIKFDGSEYESKNIYNYERFKEPDTKASLSHRYAAVLTRYPLSNAIFNDYNTLEKKKLSNDAINELLRIGKKKKKPFFFNRKKKNAPSSSYNIKTLDYAQSEVLRKVDECGNMVIYGPPGTGKSQTIVNVIADAIGKNKRVLVISQKKAALDVVYNRLGALNEKAMYITDEAKEKRSFYERCLAAHQRDLIAALVDFDKIEAEYNELQAKIDAEVEKLDRIYRVLNDKRPFGMSLSEMYSSSTMLLKNSVEYGIYVKLLECPDIMALDYPTLSEALKDIKAKNLERLYYNYIQDKDKNPIIDLMRRDVDTNTLCEVKGELVEVQKSRKGLFNIAKYPYTRQVLAYYYELDNPKNLDAIVRLCTRFTKEKAADVRAKLLATRSAIQIYAKEYDCLNRVLTPDGYLAVIDNILRGNTSYVRLVYDALDNYIDLRDVSKLLDSLDKNKIAILNFAYSISKNYQNYEDIISKLLEIRIYHEAARYEDECREDLSGIVDFPNITSRISRYKEDQLKLSVKLCEGKASRDYESLYESAPNKKDYFYQISKKQKFWPIRKVMEFYGEFILALFPCWLLSPENVSSLLPLTKNLFDIVIFDEASQVFIESTIPSIYRGKNIVVAGDAKQLRPSTTFMKRYLGSDPELQDDLSMQAALEVESLLDLAVARYKSANLTYHYRSRNQELIDFSNHAFYGMKLQVAPNISRNTTARPIERYKVNGRWIDRKNVQEAKKVVDVLAGIFRTRKNNESIGIITFNADQQSCIADMIDRECAKNPEFRSFMFKERVRVENGEDTSIFIKNLENVQGDERDIIIFSIGYAENEIGKLYTSFGSLSQEGGENRLNVAITRAKSRIIVVTSIEPEALKVETSKNLGPKLLKQYLTYVRAVAKGDTEEVRAVLAQIDCADVQPTSYTSLVAVEEQIKLRLEKLGYTVDTNLGNSNSRISLAIYDKETDKYLVGVELDRDAFAASDSCIERDVCKPRFLEARGWTLLRVWSRDWWLSPAKVIRTITQEAEKNRKKKA
jgi:DNA replication protein DnaC